MNSPVKTLLRVGGAVTLLVLGGFTLSGSFPELIGLPLLLFASIFYGFAFEKAFSIVLVIAIGLTFLWLGIQLYPDYANQPKVIVVYLIVATALTALIARLSLGNIGYPRVGPQENKREREKREAAARQLLEEKGITPRAGEPLPPWIQFPGHRFFDGLERFGFCGPADTYMDKEWVPFWTGLTINQRHEYFRNYDLGDHWPERDNWDSLWVTWEKIDEPVAYLEKLVEEATPQPYPGEPVPPWIKYPELCDATSDWRQGKGDDYLKQIFLPFFNALTAGEKEDFLRRHDLGLGWDSRDEWMHLIGWDG